MKVSGTTRLCLVLAGLALLGLGAAPVLAEIQPSSDVLLPYFELDLRGIPDVSRTTLFAICNDADDPVDVQVTIRTNWGIPVLDVQLTLQVDQVQTVNLRDWLLAGRLPDGTTLSAEMLAHLQAVLSGKPSPRDGKYYSSEVAPDLAVGAIRFVALGPGHRDVLWGDSFVVDPKIGFAEGETLVSIDPAMECLPECTRHGIRFLEDGAFDGGTELRIWTRHVAAPSVSPELVANQRIQLQAEVYDEAGRLIDRLNLSLLPIQRLKVADLGLTEPFGWIDLVTEEASFITGHYSAGDRYSAALHAWCLPEEVKPPGPRIRVDKLTNGAAADLPTGPRVPVGGTVQWSYIVTNTGDETLSDIFVTDSDGVPVTCPTDVLEPGGSMTCEAAGVAQACQRSNTARATGRPPSGVPVNDSDTSHYYGEQQGALSLQAMINGDDADTPPGPELPPGSMGSWTYEVTNTGPFPLSGVVVTDQHGAPVSCLRTSINPGESMTCTASAAAVEGHQAFIATAQGQPDCGPKVSASDPTRYYGLPNLPPVASIHLEKLTNGQDADVPPGPTLVVGHMVEWSYIVTNSGGVLLANVAVIDMDDRRLFEIGVPCPKTTLNPGESMTCTSSGWVEPRQYWNVGTARGTPPSGPVVTASDLSHYSGVMPSLEFEKLVNGSDADNPASAPAITVGSSILWAFVVTNTGPLVLTEISVTDDRGVVVTCPKTILNVGESMTCTGNGTAVAGLYCNWGAVTANGLTTGDSACYKGVTLNIAVEKRVTGQDADVPPGPAVLQAAPSAGVAL